MKVRTFAVALFCVAASAVAAPTGALKICRYPGIVGSQDGESVPIPAGSNFTGACDSNGEHCRSGVVVTTTEPTAIGPSKSLCSIVNATVTQDDGKPIRTGEPLLAQWSIAGFTPKITVARTFH